MQRYKGVEPKKKFTSSFTIAMRVAHIDPCVVPSFNFFLIYVRVGGEVGNVDSNIDISNGSMFLCRNELCEATSKTKQVIKGMFVPNFKGRGATADAIALLSIGALILSLIHI